MRNKLNYRMISSGCLLAELIKRKSPNFSPLKKKKKNLPHLKGKGEQMSRSNASEGSSVILKTDVICSVQVSDSCDNQELN